MRFYDEDGNLTPGGEVFADFCEFISFGMIERAAAEFDELSPREKRWVIIALVAIFLVVFGLVIWFIIV